MPYDIINLKSSEYDKKRNRLKNTDTTLAVTSGKSFAKWLSSIYPCTTISSVQFSSSVMSNSLRPHGLQQARLPYPSPTPGACSNSSPSSRWCHPTISSSVIPFSSHLQSFPASGSFKKKKKKEMDLAISWGNKCKKTYKLNTNFLESNLALYQET